VENTFFKKALIFNPPLTLVKTLEAAPPQMFESLNF
jgi:hypothetical protein